MAKKSKQKRKSTIHDSDLKDSDLKECIKILTDVISDIKELRQCGKNNARKKSKTGKTTGAKSHKSARKPKRSEPPASLL